MSTPQPPSDSTPVSAADIRRRLLASTPPLLAPGDPTEEAPASDASSPGTASTTGTPSLPHDLIARLKMPGKSGPVPVAASRPVPPPPYVPEPTPTRPPVNRRTPLPGTRLDHSAAIAGALHHLAGLTEPVPGRFHDDSLHVENQRLQMENQELRKLLEEMKQLLQEASDTEQQLLAKEKEYESLLAEKDSQIEQLNAQLMAIEEQIAKGELIPPPPAPKTRSELEEWADELEKENARLQQARRELDEERRQLREDEAALEEQMRQMEISMARERALIARQETELRRLRAEIEHELELMQRGDNGLREQMAKLQRRALEIMNPPPGSGGSTPRR